ncbi:MAG: SCP2 sterol-binding domain-containing protein, partial [Firmicutes bacterium]|nr:SCP2 sterol-binding domain-containing protein [Bacillota bacterium]
LSGPVASMLGLLTGSLHPISAFMAGKYKIDGDMGLGMKLAPIMSSVSKMFVGE